MERKIITQNFLDYISCLDKSEKTNNKRGQVWVETILYTLVALAIMGIVLAYATPKISQLKDQAILEQSEEIIQEIDSLIISIKDVPGNQRKIDLNLKEGSLQIDSIEDKIIFEMESELKYSEPGQIISKGNLEIYTEDKGSVYKITITSEYPNYNLTFNSNEENKIINNAPIPYNILISNEGGSPTEINFEVV